jgi:hypothetical protein
MAIQAMRYWILSGLTVLFLMLVPFSARAQAWSVQVDVPTEFNLSVSS